MSAAPVPTSPTRRIRSLAFRVFYTLPPRWRRRLVRLGAGTYTVGAVVLAGSADAPPSGDLLLVKQTPGRGWSLPAGLLDRGEWPVSAAARELAEETGVVLPPAALTPATPNAVVHPKGRWIDLVFTATVPTGAALRPDGSEIIDVGWFPLDDLPRLTPATARLLGHYDLGPLAGDPYQLGQPGRGSGPAGPAGPGAGGSERGKL